jgi:hypothetical protein
MLRQRTGAARFVPAPVTILAALVACAPAAAAPPLHLINRARPAAAVTATRALTTYGGSTSQDAPFALIVAKDHRRLSRLLLHADAPCSDGSHATESGPASIEAPGGARGGGRNLFVGNRLPKSGSFRVKGSATEGYGGTMYGKLSETLAGKVKGNRAKGTFRMTVQVIDANTGAVQATCDTGALSWRASAVPGKVYAGLTGTGRPVVVARTFDAGPFAASDGSSIALHYTLAGRLTATRATGTFAATMTQTAPDGTVQATCDRPAQSWSARS